MLQKGNLTCVDAIEREVEKFHNAILIAKIADVCAFFFISILFVNIWKNLRHSIKEEIQQKKKVFLRVKKCIYILKKFVAFFWCFSLSALGKI